MDNSVLNKIQVKVEPSNYESGNLESIIAEIKHALQQLIEQNKSHSINLRAMPWSQAEEERLLQFLGKGEVNIELNALGKSTFYETDYSGVWMVNHYNQEGEEIAKLIEISSVPEIIFAQQEDIKKGFEKLINRKD